MNTLTNEGKTTFYIEVNTMAYEMEDDLERYELPICFDPIEEQRELHRRSQKINEIAERFIRMKYHKAGIATPKQ